MARFIYKAKDGPGKTVEGEIAAESRAAAVAAIDAMGYSPILVREKSAGGKRAWAGWETAIGPRDVTLFTHQLASLSRSGVPILRSLSTIAEQTEHSRFRKVVDDLETTIRDGHMLSDALAKYPRLFPELYINMVRSGESGGVLDTILTRLADSREKEEDLRRRVQSAMAYPLLVVAVGVLTVFVLLSFFLPRVAALFVDYNRLPLPTRILIGTSGFFERYWFWIAMAALLTGAVFKRLAAIEKGRTFFDRIKLHLPLINRFVLDANIARFARTLALLIEAGIPIDRGLALSADTLSNRVLMDEIRGVLNDTVRQGLSFSQGLKKTRYFPLFVANMSAVGEEAGRLDESLAEIASFYEKDIERQNRIVVSLLEPVLILVVGAIVGFIVFAMLLPIFQIGNAL